ncbi:hypothetical protein DIPPA_19383 [Diplonema papillatum]|nr:hypothetical protein DIPPA_19383 [Diplonema papillatum]
MGSKENLFTAVDGPSTAAGVALCADLFALPADAAGGEPDRAAWAAKLLAFYSDRNPDKVEKVPCILRQFAGQEHSLWHALQQKYPTAPSATQAGAQQEPAQKSPPPAFAKSLFADRNSPGLRTERPGAVGTKARLQPSRLFSDPPSPAPSAEQSAVREPLQYAGSAKASQRPSRFHAGPLSPVPCPGQLPASPQSAVGGPLKARRPPSLSADRNAPDVCTERPAISSKANLQPSRLFSDPQSPPTESLQHADSAKASPRPPSLSADRNSLVLCPEKSAVNNKANPQPSRLFSDPQSPFTRTEQSVPREPLHAGGAKVSPCPPSFPGDPSSAVLGTERPAVSSKADPQPSRLSSDPQSPPTEFLRHADSAKASPRPPSLSADRNSLVLCPEKSAVNNKANPQPSRLFSDPQSLFTRTEQSVLREPLHAGGAKVSPCPPSFSGDPSSAVLGTERPAVSSKADPQPSRLSSDPQSPPTEFLRHADSAKASPRPPSLSADRTSLVLCRDTPAVKGKANPQPSRLSSDPQSPPTRTEQTVLREPPQHAGSAAKASPRPPSLSADRTSLVLCREIPAVKGKANPQPSRLSTDPQPPPTRTEQTVLREPPQHAGSAAKASPRPPRLRPGQLAPVACPSPAKASPQPAAPSPGAQAPGTELPESSESGKHSPLFRFEARYRRAADQAAAPPPTWTSPVAPLHAAPAAKLRGATAGQLPGTLPSVVFAGCREIPDAGPVALGSTPGKTAGVAAGLQPGVPVHAAPAAKLWGATAGHRPGTLPSVVFAGCRDIPDAGPVALEGTPGENAGVAAGLQPGVGSACSTLLHPAPAAKLRGAKAGQLQGTLPGVVFAGCRDIPDAGPVALGGTHGGNAAGFQLGVGSACSPVGPLCPTPSLSGECSANLSLTSYGDKTSLPSVVLAGYRGISDAGSVASGSASAENAGGGGVEFSRTTPRAPAGIAATAGEETSAAAALSEERLGCGPAAEVVDSGAGVESGVDSARNTPVAPLRPLSRQCPANLPRASYGTCGGTKTDRLQASLPRVVLAGYREIPAAGPVASGSASAENAGRFQPAEKTTPSALSQSVDAEASGAACSERIAGEEDSAAKTSPPALLPQSADSEASADHLPCRQLSDCFATRSGRIAGEEEPAAKTSPPAFLPQNVVNEASGDHLPCRQVYDYFTRSERVAGEAGKEPAAKTSPPAFLTQSVCDAYADNLPRFQRRRSTGADCLVDTPLASPERSRTLSLEEESGRPTLAQLADSPLFAPPATAARSPQGQVNTAFQHPPSSSSGEAFVTTASSLCDFAARLLPMDGVPAAIPPPGTSASRASRPEAVCTHDAAGAALLADELSHPPSSSNGEAAGSSSRAENASPAAPRRTSLSIQAPASTATPPRDSHGNEGSEASAPTASSLCDSAARQLPKNGVPATSVSRASRPDDAAGAALFADGLAPTHSGHRLAEKATPAGAAAPGSVPVPHAANACRSSSGMAVRGGEAAKRAAGNGQNSPFPQACALFPSSCPTSTGRAARGGEAKKRPAGSPASDRPQWDALFWASRDFAAAKQAEGRSASCYGRPSPHAPRLKRKPPVEPAAAPQRKPGPRRLSVPANPLHVSPEVLSFTSARLQPATSHAQAPVQQANSFTPSCSPQNGATCELVPDAALDPAGLNRDSQPATEPPPTAGEVPVATEGMTLRGPGPRRHSLGPSRSVPDGRQPDAPTCQQAPAPDAAAAGEAERTPRPRIRPQLKPALPRDAGADKGLDRALRGSRSSSNPAGGAGFLRKRPWVSPQTDVGGPLTAVAAFERALLEKGEQKRRQAECARLRKERAEREKEAAAWAEKDAERLLAAKPSRRRGAA